MSNLLKFSVIAIILALLIFLEVRNDTQQQVIESQKAVILQLKNVIFLNDDTINKYKNLVERQNILIKKLNDDLETIFNEIRNGKDVEVAPKL